MSPLAVTLLVTALVAAAIVAWVVVAGQRDVGRSRSRSSAIWIGASLVFALLGVFVAPKLLGFTFVFLPFLWLGGAGRRTTGRRSTGRSNRPDDGAEM